jgi:methionyl-tRNA formyltransferase
MTAVTDRPLRVLFVTEDDPLYVIRFFEVFFAECPEDVEIVGVSVQDAFHEPIWKTARRMLRFYGPIDFVRLCVRYAGVKRRGDSIARLAEKRGLTLVPCGSVNDEEYIGRVRAIRPDVIASVAAPEIFRKGILSAAPMGCINIHSGKLPVYRGMMPNFWQLLHGEKHAVVTVHEMVEKLDAGGVLGTLEWPLKPRDSLDRVITGTKRDGARLMIDVLRRMKRGEATPTPLDMSTKKYFSFPKPADVKAFRKRGHRML